jgi:hypothetical protein
MNVSFLDGRRRRYVLKEVEPTGEEWLQGIQFLTDIEACALTARRSCPIKWCRWISYSAWRTLERATHLGCMAHSRRRFVEALKTRKKGGGPPEQALKFFEQLYRIESHPDRRAIADIMFRIFGMPHKFNTARRTRLRGTSIG